MASIDRNKDPYILLSRGLRKQRGGKVRRHAGPAAGEAVLRAKYDVSRVSLTLHDITSLAQTYIKMIWLESRRPCDHHASVGRQRDTMVVSVTKRSCQTLAPGRGYLVPVAPNNQIGFSPWPAGMDFGLILHTASRRYKDEDRQAVSRAPRPG
jgi:hypothetical protein